MVCSRVWGASIHRGMDITYTINCMHCKWRAGENPIYMSGSHICERFMYFQDRSVYIFLPQLNMWTDPEGIYKSLTDTWMWKIGTEAAQFPEKEYINGIFNCSVFGWDLAKWLEIANHSILIYCSINMLPIPKSQQSWIRSQHPTTQVKYERRHSTTVLN
jgi:hypothetical protein